MEKILKFNKRRAFNKDVGPGKNPKLINVGPTFIPDYRVTECIAIAAFYRYHFSFNVYHL